MNLEHLTQQEIRTNLIRHITAVNKHLSASYLSELSAEDLVAEAHPAYRQDYSKALGLDKEKKFHPPILKMTIEE